MHTNKK